ncbi:hypothetical protein SAMN04488100_10771 [Alkalibacterium putridalgicola]|uniref:GmrSD restriction endonucleases N-terminal domain-containing protein n=1 Tax=Alkalibacterium putridalgicola TaxID=426703 RepID=A0A1H7SAD5_9LACT|nr:DUF262 domain-containing protein [Alkalibacterium putridalgicola]GEK89121.1 hypothetical protein APU01nite_11600 [Alkalibacterium putridalgicola]SEL69348.1 hypothetical protein SAMN04488100_10771 [Alkalibacterium putridalgicola]
MANYNVNNTTVNSLLSLIDEKKIAIPEIQRPFVWKSAKVRDLLDSLFNDYPVGYIITWRNPDARLKNGHLSEGKTILIDGQQRVTALMAAISGNKIVDKKYNKKNINIAFDPINEIFEVSNPAIRKDKRWIPDISFIFSERFNLFDYVEEYCEKNPEIGRNQLSKILHKLESIKHSSIGVIELSHALDIEEVTEIFIRINSAGVALSQADFAMSKISVNDEFNGPVIRKTVDYFANIISHPASYEHIQSNDKEFTNTQNFRYISWVKNYNSGIYEPSYTDILRVAFTFKFLRGRLSDLVSLLSGRDFETRDYKKVIEEESFNDLHDAVLQFVNQTNFKQFVTIIKSAGVVHNKLVRSKNTLNFAYALFLLLKDKGINTPVINKVVRKWFVISILTERYSSSPESQFDYDIKRFADAENPEDYVKRIEQGELSSAYWNTILPDNFETSVRSSPYFNLFVMAQVYLKDYAFLSNSVTVQHLIEERGDIHHIFPKRYLQKNGYNRRGVYNQIANYAYTEQPVNLKIKAQPPKEYMGWIMDQLDNESFTLGEINDSEKLKENMRMNAIPTSLSSMDVDDYEDFLVERRKLMADKIKEYYNKL